jgi:hypothetical protein
MIRRRPQRGAACVALWWGTSGFRRTRFSAANCVRGLKPINAPLTTSPATVRPSATPSNGTSVSAFQSAPRLGVDIREQLTLDGVTF